MDTVLEESFVVSQDSPHDVSVVAPDAAPFVN